MSFKYFIFQKIPPRLFVFLRGQGWRGNFKSWSEAYRLTSGYDTPIILEKSKKYLLDHIEKQNTPNIHAQYPWELISSLMWIAAQNKGCLNIVDFGGALGGTYYQNKIFFDQLETVQWNVVEQSHFVDLGKKEFENDILKFYFSVDECLSQNKKKYCILFSSVLQYLEKPYELLANILDKKIKYIIVTRTGFTKNKHDRITIQKVPKSYYDASYPCWIFSEFKFLDFLKQYGYELIYDFKDKYQLNIPSEYKGCVFKLIEK